VAQTSDASCKDCPAGYFNAVVGGVYIGSNSVTLYCAECPSGYYQGAATQTACTGCAAAKFDDSAAVAQISDASCKDCPAGKFLASTGSTSCMLCGLGRFQHEAAKTSCFQCPAQYYQPLSGSVACSSSANCPTYWRVSHNQQSCESESTALNCMLDFVVIDILVTATVTTSIFFLLLLNNLEPYFY
jgi:hypothetical protein